MNNPGTSIVEECMTPHSSGENCYKSKYWPGLNGLEEDSTCLSTLSREKSESQSDREQILLDVIGAYDLLLLHGLTPEGACIRLGLSKSRDDLVQELDSETARRLAVALSPPTERLRERV